MIIPNFNPHIPGPASIGFNKYPKDHGWSSLIGICTAIVGNILISIALNTQRYAHIRIQEQWAEKRRLQRKARRSYDSGTKPQGNGTMSQTSLSNSNDESRPLLASSRSDDETDLESSQTSQLSRKSYVKSPYWWAGIVLMTIGEAGNFLAYGFAPASIVSPLGVVAIISNCIIAPFFMKEPFRLRDFFGVVTAVGGAVTVVLSASENNPKLGPDEIWNLMTTWEFGTYVAITVCLILGLMCASNRYGQKTILIDLGLVGLFGGYTALSTKGVASLLSYTLFQALTFAITYILIFVLCLTAVMQIKYINRALQRFQATQVIPTQFVLFTLSVILGSAVLYRDFQKTAGDDAGKFVGGCALTFIGVWLITSGRPSTSDEDEQDYSDEEPVETIIPLKSTDRLPYHANIQNPTPQASATSTRRSTISSLGGNGLQRHLLTKNPSSQISLSDYLHRNNWETISERDAAILECPNLNIGYFHPVDVENPWECQDRLEIKPQSSFARLLSPFTSLMKDPNNSSVTSENTNRTTPITNSEFAQQAPTLRLPSHHHPEYPQSRRLSTPSPMYPGSFISPLSSSLSAVVADSMRRTRRRGRSALPSITTDGESLATPPQTLLKADELDGTYPLERGHSEPVGESSLREEQRRKLLLHDFSTPSKRPSGVQKGSSIGDSGRREIDDAQDEESVDVNEEQGSSAKTKLSKMIQAARGEKPRRGSGTDDRQNRLDV